MLIKQNRLTVYVHHVCIQKKILYEISCSFRSHSMGYANDDIDTIGKSQLRNRKGGATLKLKGDI